MLSCSRVLSSHSQILRKDIVSKDYRTKLKREGKFNSALQIKDKSEFIKSHTQDMPTAPDHFSRCSDINRKGPAMVADLPLMEELTADQFKERIKDPNVLVLDTRSYHAFGSQHIPGAWHLDLDGNFPTFAGWVLPTDKDILLVAEDYRKAVETAIWAHRVGMDRIVGYLDGGMVAWAVAGFKTNYIRQISAEDLHNMITGTSKFVLLDVRAPMEYKDTHIKGTINIPVGDLRTLHNELNNEKLTILICSSGNRSNLGASILKQHEFKDVYNVAGGMTGYSAAGYTKQCRVCENPHGSRFLTNYREVKKHWDVE